MNLVQEQRLPSGLPAREVGVHPGAGAGRIAEKAPETSPLNGDRGLLSALKVIAVWAANPRGLEDFAQIEAMARTAIAAAATRAAT